ncbi:MAG: hypothetical protein EBU06_04640 [Micrococcales bacterium]|nr:hypothetical protein [Micrococcales bacterium]
MGVLLRVVGKSIGITIGAYLGSKFSKDSLSRKTYARLSVLGGIGFTVAFFVNDIVFKDQELFHKQALIASLLAALITVLIASFTLKNRQK